MLFVRPCVRPLCKLAGWALSFSKLLRLLFMKRSCVLKKTHLSELERMRSHVCVTYPSCYDCIVQLSVSLAHARLHSNKHTQLFIEHNVLTNIFGSIIIAFFSFSIKTSFRIELNWIELNYLSEETLHEPVWYNRIKVKYFSAAGLTL